MLKIFVEKCWKITNFYQKWLQIPQILPNVRNHQKITSDLHKNFVTNWSPKITDLVINHQTWQHWLRHSLRVYQFPTRAPSLGCRAGFSTLVQPSQAGPTWKLHLKNYRGGYCRKLIYSMTVGYEDVCFDSRLVKARALATSYEIGFESVHFRIQSANEKRPRERNEWYKQWKTHKVTKTKDQSENKSTGCKQTCEETL